MNFRDQLAQLIELQSAEIDARALEAELALLPGERNRLELRVATARELVAAAESDRETSLKARHALEVQVQAAEAKVEKYREHEMQVKTNAQLWALQAEMKTEQDKIDELESSILEAMEHSDVRAAQIEERKGELGVTETEVSQEILAVDARRVELESKQSGELERIAALRGGVDADLLATYDRICSARAGIGVAEVVDGNCGACNVRLRPQLALQAVNMEQPQQCDNCKRILFSRVALQPSSAAELETPSSVEIGSPD